MRLEFSWWQKKMSKLAIIGGSALDQLRGFHLKEERILETPFGEPSSPLRFGEFEGKEIVFLDRHGQPRTTPPHKINYRANLWALYSLGIEVIIGVSIVGGIRSDMTAGHFVFPDQLIDYTYNRPNTFFEEDFDYTRHIDFTYPYCPGLHEIFINAAQQLNLDYSDDATYGVTQGPRFETIAEINRLEKDGCDIVGMTAMPEAVLARELLIRYGCIAMVGSKAPGRTDGLDISIESIRQVVDDSVSQLHDLLGLIVKEI